MQNSQPLMLFSDYEDNLVPLRVAFHDATPRTKSGIFGSSGIPIPSPRNIIPIFMTIPLDPREFQ